MKKLAVLLSGQKITVNLKARIELSLGSANNKVVVERMSPWLHFKDKDRLLTKQYYVMAFCGKKLLGDNECLTLGKIRNRIYFGNEGEWDKKLSLEHAKLTRSGKILLVENVSNTWIKIFK